MGKNAIQEDFHEVGGLLVIEQQAKNTRAFTGDGTPYLRVPSLKKLQSVRIGSQEIPLSITQEFPVDTTLTKFEERETALIKVTKLEDGCPVLLRSKQSNDGIWQKDAPVYIAGDWDAEKPNEQQGQGQQAGS